MAYNQDKSIIIVDTQNWAVKKTLTDEKVFCFPSFFLMISSNFNNDQISPCFVYVEMHSRTTRNTVYVRIQSVANILQPVVKVANFQYGTSMQIN